MERIIKFLLIPLIAMMAVSCGTTKKTQTAELLTQTETLQSALAEQKAINQELRSKHQQVSNQLQQTLLYYAESIPASQTKQDIPLKDLADLPDGSGYSSTSGQSSLDIKKNGDKLQVTARCSELERKVEYLEQVNSQSYEVIDSLSTLVESKESQISELLASHEVDLKTMASETKQSTWG